jgi:hypothetical protein
MFALRKGGSIIVHVNLFARIHWIEDLDDEAVMQGQLPPPPSMTKKDLQGKYGRFRRDYAETSWPVFDDGGYYYENAAVNLTRKNLRMLYFNGPHPF